METNITIRNKKTEQEKLNPNQIRDYVSEHHIKLNGDMTTKEISEKLNVSYCVVYYHLKAIMNGGRRNYKYVFLTEEEEIEFLNYYEIHGSEATFEKYKDQGFKDYRTVMGKANTIRNKIKRNQNKKG